MAQRFTRRILTHMARQPGEHRTIRELARELQIPKEDLQEFEEAVRKLEEAGQVVLGDRHAVSLPPPGKAMTGIFRLTRRGFGFVIPDLPTEHGDLFVPAQNTQGALNGDHVKASVRQERRRTAHAPSPYVGEIVEIIQRADATYVGTLARRGSNWVVEPDGKRLPEPILIRDPTAKNARAGDKVVVEMIQYPAEGRSAEGVISEVLGDAGEPDVETKAVIRAFGLPDGFPEEVVEDAREAARRLDVRSDQEQQLVEAEGASGAEEERADFTELLTFTIDPPDARDYDDAISVERLDPHQSGGAAYELGVHIADVAHFVEPDRPLDQEARQRGNSVYLPRHVIPMLPELLSNGVCSLQEGVDRFVKSVFIRYDGNGKVIGARFARSVIRSAKRLTYLEAQALIGGDIREARKHAKEEPKYPKPLMQALQLADELARTIRERRLRHGMIVLDLPSPELVFNEHGEVVDAHPEDDAFTHKLIEAFMVEANEAVGRLFDRLRVPMIRRIHPDPPQQDMTDLRRFARVAGFNIPANPSRKELQTLLDAVRGKAAQYSVHLAVLKTLSRAEYSPLLVGHFALGSEHYTHFTSPIRRYADLIVHRALSAVIDAGGNNQTDRQLVGRLKRRELQKDSRLPDEATLAETGRHCSHMERNAEAAERELKQYFLLVLLSEHEGEQSHGTVTGVSGDGVFVQLDRYLVEGFVRSSELPGSERWRLNRQTGALAAQRSGKTIQIGDRLEVQIARVEPSTRTLDLVVLHLGGSNSEGKRQEKKSKKNEKEETIAGGEGRKKGGKPDGGAGSSGGGKKKGGRRRKQSRGAAKSHAKTMEIKRKKK